MSRLCPSGCFRRITPAVASVRVPQSIGMSLMEILVGSPMILHRRTPSRSRHVSLGGIGEDGRLGQRQEVEGGKIGAGVLRPWSGSALDFSCQAAMSHRSESVFARVTHLLVYRPYSPVSHPLSRSAWTSPEPFQCLKTGRSSTKSSTWSSYKWCTRCSTPQRAWRANTIPPRGRCPQVTGE